MITSLVHNVLTFCNKTFSLVPFSADKLSSELSAKAIHCSTWEWRKLFHVYLKNKSWKQTITATCTHTHKSKRFNNEKSLNEWHISCINIFLYTLGNLRLLYPWNTPNRLESRQCSTCIWEVLSLNFSQDTSNCELFHGFPQSLHENARIISWSGYNQFIPNHPSSYHLTLHSLATDSITK